jgi:hypothetical protein
MLQNASVTLIQLNPEGPTMTPPMIYPNIGGRERVVQIHPKKVAATVKPMIS